MNAFDLEATLSLDTSQYESALLKARNAGSSFASSGGGGVTGATSKMTQGFTVLKGVVANLVTGGINMLAGAITQNLGGAISRVDILNNYTKVMVNLGYGAEEADAAIDQLAEGIDGLPTTLPAIASLQQQFAALNGNMEESTKLSLALNNATLAGGQGQEMANSAMNQWYQIIANGKPDLQSWRIINMAMPAQLKQISQELLGDAASAEDLRQAWMDGTVATEDVTKALIKLNEEGGDSIESFADQAKSATGGIQTSMTNIKTAIQKGLADVIENGIGGENIAAIFDGIKVGIKEAFGEVTTFVNNIKEVGLATAIRIELRKAQLAFQDFAKNVDVQAVLKKIIDAVVAGAPVVLTGLGNLLNDLADWLSENGAEAIIQLGIGFVKALPALISYMGQVVNAILKVVVGIPVRLLAIGASAMGNFVLGILKKANSAATAASKVVNSAVKSLKKAAVLFAAQGLTAVVRFVLAINKGVSKAKAAARKLVNGAVSAVKNGIKGITSAGAALVTGFWNGISNKAGWLKRKISGWVGDVKAFLKKLFGIKSPSKWARDEVGAMIAEGMALGITDNEDVVNDAMSGLMDEIDDGYTVTRSTSSDNGRMINPVFNTTVNVSGAEDPTLWADRFSEEFLMKVRTA